MEEYDVEQNDGSLTKLTLSNSMCVGIDFDRLGRAIATNTKIIELDVSLQGITLNVTDKEFYNGLKQNSSIHEVVIRDGFIMMEHGVGSEILRAYQENNNHIKRLSILNAVLANRGDEIITATLQCCTNLTTINLYSCNITADKLLAMVEVMRGINSLEKLLLNSNRIGDAGCEALATLLEDPNSNVEQLQLFDNRIFNKGAIAIANSLTNNTKLKQLYFGRNPFDQIVEDVFVKILCNTASINETYSSNHKVEHISLPYEESGQLKSLLTLNKEGMNESRVAIRKILLHHPNIDMKPFFKLDGGEEDNLKALPYIVDWFSKADLAVTDNEERQRCSIDGRKLSAIYQFALAMPLQLIPASHTKVDDKKRKRYNA